MSRNLLLTVFVVALLGLGAPAQAQQFVLRTSVFSAGSAQSSGGNLVLHSTLGQPAIGRTADATLLLDGGFWPQATGAAGPVALPTALDDEATTDEDTPVVIDVLANDADAGGGSVAIESFRRGDIGTVALTDTMTLVYSPVRNAFGSDTFTYRIINDAGGIAEATVRVTVNPVNDAPQFLTFPPEPPVGVGEEFRYLSEVRDVDGDALTFEAPVLPAWLMLAEPTDTTVTVVGTPTAADVGAHPVTLTVGDGQAADTLHFTVVVAQSTLAAPVLVAPEDGAADQPLDVLLRWDAVAGATGYELRIDTDSTFQPPFVADVGTVNPQFLAQGLLAPNTTYFWRVRAVDASGPGPYAPPFRFTTAVSVATDRADVPAEFRLDQNYPNPFNPATTIAYDLPQPAAVRLAVYDVHGREVARLVEAMQPAGRHEVSFDAGDLASGTYFYRIEAAGFTATRALVLVR